MKAGVKSTIRCENLVADVAAALRRAADPVRTDAMQAYMRNQFAFLGVPTPLRRAVTAPLARAFQPQSSQELLAAARMLWQESEREFQYVAVDLLARYRKILDPGDLPALLALVRKKSWWDSVDGLAVVVGSIVRRFPREAQPAMDRAVSDRNLWMRRVAMLHQLGWRADTDTKRLYAYAEQLGQEKEFFIQKAIGWALRDYARHDPAAVRAFLVRAGKRLSALSVREASRHLHARSRQPAPRPDIATRRLPAEP